MNVGAALASVQVFLADGGNSPADVDPTTGHGPEWGKAGPIGLLTIVLLCVAVYFLVKSMNRNIKKVPESFDPAAKVAGSAGGAESTTADTPGSAVAQQGGPASPLGSASSAGTNAADAAARAAE